MEYQRRSINKIVEDQVKKWHYQNDGNTEIKQAPCPVVTISREPGSGGRIIAEKLAQKLGFDLFHQEVVHEMAKDANISVRFMETLDERGLTTLDNWIASIVDERYLWPDQYMQHLMKVIGTIGRHGNSVIVGRGANFILQPQVRVSVRFIAPFDIRCKNVAEEFSISMKEAGKRITLTESRRRSFIRKHFNASISDDLNYDLIINTGSIGIDGSVETLCAVVKQKG